MHKIYLVLDVSVRTKEVQGRKDTCEVQKRQSGDEWTRKKTKKDAQHKKKHWVSCLKKCILRADDAADIGRQTDDHDHDTIKGQTHRENLAYVPGMVGMELPVKDAWQDERDGGRAGGTNQREYNLQLRNSNGNDVASEEDAEGHDDELELRLDNNRVAVVIQLLSGSQGAVLVLALAGQGAVLGWIAGLANASRLPKVADCNQDLVQAGSARMALEWEREHDQYNDGDAANSHQHAVIVHLDNVASNCIAKGQVSQNTNDVVNDHS